MVDTSMATGTTNGAAPPAKKPTSTGVGSSSGSAAGIVAIIQIFAAHYGLGLTVEQAIAIAPLTAVMVDPFRRVIGALVDRLVHCIEGDEHA